MIISSAQLIKIFEAFNVQLYSIAHYHKHWMSTVDNKEYMGWVLKIQSNIKSLYPKLLMHIL